jgi:iron complex transport system permease protein
VFKSNQIKLNILLILLPVVMILHLTAGDFEWNFQLIKQSLFNFDQTDTYQVIFRDFRLPRLIIGVLAGAGLSIAGLLMQTLFNNPLAGPYILGINSGASLFAAISIMTGVTFFTSEFGTITSSLLGAFIFGLIILSFSLLIRSKVSLLLIGVMLGSFSGALITVIQSMSDAFQLKKFTIWTMGSLQQVSLSQFPMILLVFLLAIVLLVFTIKPLNTLVIGEEQASLLGLPVKRIRIVLILITALFTGLITAYCGPIAFVGLAVPNLVKMIFKTQNHKILLLGSGLLGVFFLLLSDWLVQFLWDSIHLPLNAITSLIGAPFVIVIILKRLA